MEFEIIWFFLTQIIKSWVNKWQMLKSSKVFGCSKPVNDMIKDISDYNTGKKKLPAFRKCFFRFRNSVTNLKIYSSFHTTTTGYDSKCQHIKRWKKSGKIFLKYQFHLFRKFQSHFEIVSKKWKLFIWTYLNFISTFWPHWKNTLWNGHPLQLIVWTQTENLKHWNSE